MELAFILKLYYKTTKRETLKAFYDYLGVSIDEFAYLDHLFGSKPTKENKERFLKLPFIKEMLVSCFSEGNNMLLVILNLGDEHQDDETFFDDSLSIISSEPSH